MMRIIAMADVDLKQLVNPSSEAETLDSSVHVVQAPPPLDLENMRRLLQGLRIDRSDCVDLDRYNGSR